MDQITAPTSEVASPSPVMGGGGSFYYGSLEEFAAATGGRVALVRVSSIGDVQYNTLTGNRPSSVEELDGTIAVGRIVTVQLQRLVTGRWAVSDEARYWQPGGAIGSDSTPAEGFMGLPRPETGKVLVAFLLPKPADIDPTSGQLLMDIVALFPVNDAGQVVTPDAAEHIPADRLADFLKR